MKVNCRYCKSTNVVKYGKRNCKKGGIQRYFCKDCNRYFSENTCFAEMKQKGKIIATALHMYNKNISLRRIVKYLRVVYGIEVSHVTILKWAKKFRL